MDVRLIIRCGITILLATNHAPAQDCSIPYVPSQFKARLAWQSGQDGVSVLATPVVANMNPHQDSMPEIIVAEGNLFAGLNSRIQFFRGDGSNANNPLILNIPGNFDYYPAPGPTIGDVNRNGIPELLITCADRRIRVFNNYTENPAAPMTLWITSADLVDFIDQRPLLADFDGDGIPEVYAGSDIFKFNFSNPAAPTLTKVINGPGNQGRAQYANYAQGACNPTAVDILSVADCNGDPDCEGLELVAGPVIYSIDVDPNDGDGYQIKVQRNLNAMAPPPTGYSDGYTAVADVNLDGELDIIVTSSRGNQYGMYVWNKNGLIRFFPYPTNVANSGSLACVANVYDDTGNGHAQDFPEILVCSSLNFTCFSLQAAQTTPATPYWWNLPTSDVSGWTGSTVYDFNGDGISEIVYRDERNLRILYGGGQPFPPGVDAERNWFRTPCFSGTSDEYAVVADVDNDGETEIVVTGRLVDNNFTQMGRLHVFESDAGPWVPCRNVWNQYNYFIVNVNDDLSIPAQQALHHLELPTPGSGNRPLNRYLSQRPVLNDDFLPYIPLPDASTATTQIICDTTTVTVRLELCNTGDKTLPAATPVAFYLSDPTTTNAATFGTIQLTNAPILKDSCRFFNFILPKIPGTYFGVVNDNASLPTPFQLGIDFPSTPELECNFLNNIFQFEIPGLPPAISLGPDLSTCADTLVLLDAGQGFVQYQWQDGSTGSSFLAQQTGLYWVETIDACLQRQADSVRIEIFGYPAIQLDTINGDCSGNPAAVTALVQGAYAPFDYLWSSGEAAPGLSGLSDGFYTVTVTNARGCSSVQSTWVEAGGHLEVSAFVATPILCFGESGNLGLEFFQGTPPYSIQWSDGSEGPALPNAAAGNYAVTITDADHCADTLLIAITQPELLVSMGMNSVPTCPGLALGAASFLGAEQGTPPYTLLWSNNETQSNLSGLAEGSYTLTLTDANGCTRLEQVLVPAFEAPAVEVVASDVSCFGQNDGFLSLNILSGSPAFAFSWSNQASTNQIQGLQPGPYALTLTYADGSCAQTYDFQIDEPLPLLLSAVANPALCHGLGGGVDLTVQNGVAPLSFAWSNNAVTQNLNGIGPGNYQVTVTDAIGCEAIFGVDLSEPTALLSAGVSATAACPGEANGSAVFLGASQGTPPYTLLWSTNESGATINNIPAGSYQLTLSDANGCTVLEQLQVAEFAAPSLQADISHVTCFGENNGAISVLLAGGSPGFEFAWSNAATSQDIDLLPPGHYNLTLRFADGSCADTFDFQITEPPPLILENAGVTPVQCFGEQNGAIQVNISGGTAPYLFFWNGQTGTENLSTLSTGTYALTLTDQNGCLLYAQFFVPQPEALTLNALVHADTCQSASGAISPLSAGGVPPYLFNWSNNSTDPYLIQLSAGLYELTLSDANTCTTHLTMVVPQYGEHPVLSTFTDTINCLKPSIQVGVMADQNNLSYHWSGPNGSLPDAASHNVQSPGNYGVTATNTFGCQTAALLVVVEDTDVPIAEAGPPILDIDCNETAALLDATHSSHGSGFLNRWTQFQQGVAVRDTASLLLSIREQGLYVHTVLNLRNGCSAQDSIWVNWDAPIVAVFAVDSIRCHGDGNGRIFIQSVSGGNSPYFFSLGNLPFSTQNQFGNLGPGNYLLRIRDDFGCAWEHSVVLVEPAPISVKLSASDTALVLGQTLQLLAQTQPNGVAWAAIDWEPEGLPFVPMSLQQRLKPQTHTEFVVRITDPKGCVAEDRLWVSVYNHNIYVPNIILPGSDLNGWFTVFAGEGVSEIRSLQVFDRWGEQVFRRQGFQPNAPNLGWDGTHRGQPMNPGVFVWYAEVLLQNGQIVFLKGDVTVVR